MVHKSEESPLCNVYSETVLIWLIYTEGLSGKLIVTPCLLAYHMVLGRRTDVNTSAFSRSPRQQAPCNSAQLFLRYTIRRYPSIKTLLTGFVYELLNFGIITAFCMLIGIVFIVRTNTTLQNTTHSFIFCDMFSAVCIGHQLAKSRWRKLKSVLGWWPVPQYTFPFMWLWFYTMVADTNGQNMSQRINGCLKALCSLW